MYANAVPGESGDVGMVLAILYYTRIMDEIRVEYSTNLSKMYVFDFIMVLGEVYITLGQFCRLGDLMGAG